MTTTGAVQVIRRIRWEQVLIAGVVVVTAVMGLRHVRHDLGVTAADGEGYWQAALRIREGLPLYVGEIGAATYRYAPWFAFAWVPLTYLPHQPVMLAWIGVQLAALGYLLWPLLRTPAGIALAALVGSLLVRTALIGQVHLLMLAGLAWGLSRRWGWIAIGLAASLKVFPLVFAIRYVRRRDWRSLALTCGFTALLWAPALFFNLSSYPTGGFNPPLPLPVMLALAAVATVVAFRSERYGDLAASVAIIFGDPRWNHYTPGYVLVPAAARATGARKRRGTSNDDSRLVPDQV